MNESNLKSTKKCDEAWSHLYMNIYTKKKEKWASSELFVRKHGENFLHLWLHVQDLTVIAVRAFEAVFPFHSTLFMTMWELKKNSTVFLSFCFLPCWIYKLPTDIEGLEQFEEFYSNYFQQWLTLYVHGKQPLSKVSFKCAK